MYSVPFYGESSFLMYRKDMFEQAGIKVNPDPNYQPTWQEVAEWAKTIKAKQVSERASACAASPAGVRCSRRWTPSSTPSAAAGSTTSGTRNSTAPR